MITKQINKYSIDGARQRLNEFCYALACTIVQQWRLTLGTMFCLRPQVVRLVPTLMLGLFMIGLNCFAQTKPKSKSPQRAKSTSISSSYRQIGNTALYCYQQSNSIDMMGYYNGYYYGSTYSNNGYKVALQVNGSSATQMNCLSGSTLSGVQFVATVEPQGELARVCYTLTNTNNTDVIISMGTHADVMIGSNDSAPIERRKDQTSSTYGLTMKDGNGAQLCVLFGAGLAGVSKVDDFWFGQYSLNSSASAMVGNYSSGSNYMVENGRYDSGMGWCWKNRTIHAGATVVFSYLIGVGDVRLEPNSSFVVTPDDPDGWNDLSLPHQLTLNGEYESPAGIDGKIEYAVEDSEEWLALTDTLASGDMFNATITAMFDPDKATHTIRFRTVDAVGNTSMLAPIVYKDVSYYALSGIEELTFTGDSLYQTSLTCELDEDTYQIGHYANNVNSGTATFSIDGVFPYTIGRKTYYFFINPAPLPTQVELLVPKATYNGTAQQPWWKWADEVTADLQQGRDYEVSFEDNVYPGTGYILIKGIGNYMNTLRVGFTIDKAPMNENLISITLPEEDICYDGKPHPATVTKSEGVGDVLFTYISDDESRNPEDAPLATGVYDIYVEVKDGTLYYGVKPTKIGSLVIYDFDRQEWALLQTLCTQLKTMGWNRPWDMAGGITEVNSFEGLVIQQGHVVGIRLDAQELQGSFPFVLFSFPYLKEVNLSNNSLSGDLGLMTAAYIEKIGQAPIALNGISINGNAFSGNIGLFAYCLPALTTLKAAGNAFEDVIPMISPKVTTLEIGGQKMNRTITLDISNVDIVELAKQIPTIAMYDHTSQSYTKNMNLLCTDGEWGAILSVNGERVIMACASDDNVYRGASGNEFDVYVQNSTSGNGSTCKMKLYFAMGDGNFDGTVNILDLQTTLNYMFGLYKTYPFNYTAANIYVDDMINVQDAVCLVNMLLDNAPSSAATRKKVHTRVDDNQVGSANVYCDGTSLILESETPVASFDIVIDGTQQTVLTNQMQAQGFVCQQKAYGDKVRVIGYSLLGATTCTGKTVIAHVDGQGAFVSSATLSDIDACEVNARINNTTTDIQSMQRELQNGALIYTLSGMKVNSVNALLKGHTYIVKKSAVSKKVTIQ